MARTCQTLGFANRVTARVCTARCGVQSASPARLATPTSAGRCLRKTAPWGASAPALTTAGCAATMYAERQRAVVLACRVLPHPPLPPSLQPVPPQVIDAGEECDHGVSGPSGCCAAGCVLRPEATCDPEHSPCCTGECVVEQDTRQACRPAAAGDECDGASLFTRCACLDTAAVWLVTRPIPLPFQSPKPATACLRSAPLTPSLPPVRNAGTCQAGSARVSAPSAAPCVPAARTSGSCSGPLTPAPSPTTADPCSSATPTLTSPTATFRRRRTTAPTPATARWLTTTPRLNATSVACRAGSARPSARCGAGVSGPNS